MKASRFKAVRIALLGLVVLAASFPGEAAKPVVKRDPEKDRQIAATVPVCTGAEDCAAKWEAAQLWVVKHSSYKLQIVTDVLLETYGTGLLFTSDPLEDGRVFARVTKEPAGAGSYRLVASIGCIINLRAYGKGSECVKAQDLTLDFNATVAAAQATPPIPASTPPRTPGVRVTGGEPGCSPNAMERLRARGMSEEAIREICAD